MPLGWILLLSNALLVVLVWWSGHIALALVLAALWSGGQIWFWGRTARQQGERLRQLDKAPPDDPTWVEGFHPELARALEDLAERIQQRVHRLESENNRLEVILESITEAILVVDRDGRVVLANKALANLFGLDPPLEGLLTAEVVRYSAIQDALGRVFGRRPTARNGSGVDRCPGAPFGHAGRARLRRERVHWRGGGPLRYYAPAPTGADAPRLCGQRVARAVYAIDSH